jgi:hypothetical protein
MSAHSVDRWDGATLQVRGVAKKNPGRDRGLELPSRGETARA